MPSKEGAKVLAHRELITSLETLERIARDVEELRLQSKDILNSLKDAGHPTKVVRALLVLRAMDPDKRSTAHAEREMLGEYADALDL